MKRVLLIPDVLHWAWGRRCQSLRRYAPADIIVDIIPQCNFTADMPDRYDGTLVFSWPDSPVCSDKVWTFVANEGCQYPWVPNADNAVRRTASRIKNKDTAAKRIPRFRGVITINHRTFGFLKNLNPNTHLLRTGVDCEVFKPLRPVRTEPPYRIGWCGKAFNDPKKWTPKGYHEVLVPLMERFRGDKRIEWVINRRDVSNALSESEMVEWYNDIDLLLVTSCSEGTPSSLLESMACGRGFLATNVGIVSEAQQFSQEGFLTFGGWRVADAWRNTTEAYEVVAILDHTIRIAMSQCEIPRMSPIARRTVEQHYNWDALAADWLHLILT